MLKSTYFAAIVTVSFAFLSDRVKYRFPFILAGHAMCILGFGIQISSAHFGVKYFGTFFCVAGSYSAFPGVITWYIVLCEGLNGRRTKPCSTGWPTMLQANTSEGRRLHCTLALEILQDVCPRNSVNMR